MPFLPAQKQLGYDVIEIHAGQIRNKTKILQMFGEATQSHRLPTTQQQQQGFGQKLLNGKKVVTPTSTKKNKRKRGKSNSNKKEQEEKRIVKK